MVKGDKIVDLRDNSVHIIDSIDVYDTVTLVFTEGKQYISMENIRVFTNEEIVKDVIDKNPDIFSDYEDKITKQVSESFELHLKNLSKKLGLI